MSTFISGRLEARGLTASSGDVRGLENFLNSVHRPYGESNAFVRTRPTSSPFNSQSKSSFLSTNTNNYHNNRHHHDHDDYNNGYDINGEGEYPSQLTRKSTSRNIRAASAPSATPTLLFRYLNPKEMKLDLNGNAPGTTTAPATPHNGFINSRNTRSYRASQSAGPARPSTKRQIAVQCGIKTISIDGRRWKNDSNISTTGKGQIVFQGPQGGGTHSRRGLRGSKVRPGASTPRPGSQARHKLDTPDPSYGLREGSAVTTPRNLSVSTLQHSHTSLNGPLADDEEISDNASGYGWNASDQGLRLQKHLSHKTSIRSMRRVSEMVHHRLDPMYKINGSKVTLQDRYCLDGVEMQKLQEMTITREELLSDLRKMKFHNNNSKTYANQMSSQKHRLLQQNISRLQQPSNSSIYPPTPAASDLDTARSNVNKNNYNNNNDDVDDNNDNDKPKQLSQHSEEDGGLGIIDDDGDDEDDDDEFDDNNDNDNRVREERGGGEVEEEEGEVTQ